MWFTMRPRRSRLSRLALALLCGALALAASTVRSGWAFSSRKATAEALDITQDTATMSIRVLADVPRIYYVSGVIKPEEVNHPSCVRAS